MTLADEDHARGCEGRTYTCTCGYDDRVEAALRTTDTRAEVEFEIVEWLRIRAKRYGDLKPKSTFLLRSDRLRHTTLSASADAIERGEHRTTKAAQANTAQGGVTQADRDAAEHEADRIYLANNDVFCERDRDLIRDNLTEAFTRHRIAARAAGAADMRERAVRVTQEKAARRFTKDMREMLRRAADAIAALEP